MRWTDEEEQRIRTAARRQHPPGKGATIAAGVVVFLVAVPLLMFWVALMVRLARWVF